MSIAKGHVAVGLSGGVDSSLTAALLKEQGYTVTGITMAIYDGTLPIQNDARDACYGPGEAKDIAAAQAICRQLDIPFHVIDLKTEYRQHVIDYFKNEYLAGRTPNPCIVCNRKLKFGFLLEKAKKTGIAFDFFATGHYAQIVKRQKRYLIKKAVDASKDQTYFLYGLTQAQLAQTIFPLGGYYKQEVRQKAQAYGLLSSDRPESQDFLAGGDYSVLFNAEELKTGKIIDQNGRCLGHHRGIVHHTVGQRRGLGIAAAQPLYVKEIDPENNQVIVGDRASLYAGGLIISDMHLHMVDKIEVPTPVEVKIRLNQKATAATIYPDEPGKAKIIFATPQMAVAPGQSAVCYLNETVFGGGIIEKSIGVEVSL